MSKGYAHDFKNPPKPKRKATVTNKPNLLESSQPLRAEAKAEVTEDENGNKTVKGKR